MDKKVRNIVLAVVGILGSGSSNNNDVEKEEKHARNAKLTMFISSVIDDNTVF